MITGSVGTCPGPETSGRPPARQLEHAGGHRVLASVLDLCTPEVRIYPNEFGGRDVFALGGVIVKSSHLKEDRGRDFEVADANEVAAIAIARPVLAEMNIQVPEIYFSGKIDGHGVLVQERIAGVGLNVAKPYLSAAQKAGFKDQARAVLCKLHAVKAPPTLADGQPARRSYVVPDPDPVTNHGIQPAEFDIIFGQQQGGGDLGFMNNDLTESNLIVDDDCIVGVVDWEMAGFFGWDAAAEVHLRIRGANREMYASLNLAEEVLSDIVFWNDLYEQEG